jgi:hypothetical protein
VWSAKQFENWDEYVDEVVQVPHKHACMGVWACMCSGVDLPVAVCALSADLLHRRRTGGRGRAGSFGICIRVQIGTCIKGGGLTN